MVPFRMEAAKIKEIHNINTIKKSCMNFRMQTTNMVPYVPYKRN